MNKKKNKDDRKVLTLRYRIDENNHVSFIDPCCDEIPAQLFGYLMEAISNVEKKWNNRIKPFFSVPCVIHKHNSKIENYLQMLGYESCKCSESAFLPDATCCTPCNSKYHVTDDCMEILSVWGDNAVDCGTNEELFFSIAALRDDSDIDQWFTDGEKWVKSDLHDLIKFKKYFDEIEFDYAKTHKATVQELVAHFK